MFQLIIRQPNYVPTLEDQIEAERQKKVEELKRLGKGTPITPETFAAWQDRKRKSRQAANQKKVEAELKKKKGGKGLAVLSGRALYEYKKDLFEDRDDDDMDSSTGSATISRQASAVSDASTNGVAHVAEKVQSELFLDGDDDDLDDLVDDD